MNKNDLYTFFDKTVPSDQQKQRMLDHILKKPHKTSKKAIYFTPRGLTAIAAACIVFFLTLFGLLPQNPAMVGYAMYITTEDGIRYKLADYTSSYEDLDTSVSYVDSRPSLEFYIDGQDIDQVQITSKNEYLYVVDTTKTLDEKYWNPASYQDFDEDQQISIFYPELLYEKSITLAFDEDFSDYKDVWYRWSAWNLYQWAAADNYAHFLGAGQTSANMSQEEEMNLAATSNDGIGHIQLEGYPDELTEDIITITVTDRKGHASTTKIHVKITNNELHQTVVTAQVID